MGQLRRYTGTTLLAAGWTALLAVVAYAVVVRGVVSIPTVAGQGPVVVLAVAWLVGLGLLRRRDRRHWLAMAQGAGFSPQHGGRGLVALQKSYRLRTITAAAEGSLVGRRHTVVRASVNQVEAPIEMDLHHRQAVEEAAGFTTGNPTIDAAWRLETNSTRHLKAVLDHELQSAMMDLTVEGTLHVTNRAVTFEVPFVRLSAAELAQVAELVTTAAERLEGVAGDR
jgi:hypothetical protein